MTGPHILFVCNAGREVGGGHVMRSLTLAEALAERGASCTFLAPPPVAALLDAFAPAMERAPAPSTVPADMVAAAQGLAADALVFDHYGLTAADHHAIAVGRPALAIDDLANREMGADLVVDSGPARRAEDYAGLTLPGVPVLTGPAFAPVRPQFAALREQALARRGGPVRRVLVSMGLTDLGAVTERVVARLLPLLGDVAVDVVLGAGAPSLAPLQAAANSDRRIALHIDTQDMPRLTLEADIGVGAAGSTTWERCVLGLPSLLVVLADNQRPAARALGEAGAALVLEAGAPDFENRLAADLRRLLADEALRGRLADLSAQVCDGRGAARVAEAFLRLIPGCDNLASQP